MAVLHDLGPAQLPSSTKLCCSAWVILRAARRAPPPPTAQRSPTSPVRASPPSDPLADSGRVQSGLVSLGALHTRAGHITKALAALHEAVRTAQQHNDAAMLAHALAGLAWLLGRTPLGMDGACGVHRPLALTAAHHAHVRLLLQRWGSICIMFGSHSHRR